MTSMPQCTFGITRTLPTKILFYAIQLHLKLEHFKIVMLDASQAQN